MKSNVGRWLIEHDAETTRQCFAQRPIGTGCDCSECRNFIAALDHAFPPSFRALADTFGIDLAKPAELCHWCREPSGLHLTAGWFHFVGSILSGSDALQHSGTRGTFHLEQFAPDFELGFSSHLALVPDSFSAHSVTQLEFQTRVPWVIADSEVA